MVMCGYREFRGNVFLRAFQGLERMVYGTRKRVFYEEASSKLTSYRTRPASCKQARRSSRRGISSSVVERKTCLKESNVHSF